MTIDATLDAVPPRAPVASSIASLLTAPILPTLLRLAIPNMIAMVGSTLVSIAETSYIGRLGTIPLAAIALVFPFAMLTQMMSAGAMGGGVSSAISRALGAGDRDRAATLALHAAIIGFGGGLFFTVMMLVFGRSFFALLGGHGRVLEEASGYSQVLFSGAVAIWLVNTLASVIRGTGDMRLPSMTLIAAGVLQIALGGTLGLGLFGVKQFGMPGVASGQLIAFSFASIFLLWYLASGRSRLPLNLRAFHFERAMFLDILKVGAVACLSPLQTVLTILVFTKILATFGTEMLAGYGIGSRLEFLLIPITFAFGIASVPMVGVAMGAGHVKRARRGWTAAAASGLTVGLVGLVIAIYPRYGSRLYAGSRRHRRRLQLFPLGRPGLRVLRHRCVALLLLARRDARRRPRARFHRAASDRCDRRHRPDDGAGARLDVVRAGRRCHGRVRPVDCGLRRRRALGQMSAGK